MTDMVIIPNAEYSRYLGITATLERVERELTDLNLQIRWDIIKASSIPVKLTEILEQIRKTWEV